MLFQDEAICIELDITLQTMTITYIAHMCETYRLQTSHSSDTLRTIQHVLVLFWQLVLPVQKQVQIIFRKHVCPKATVKQNFEIPRHGQVNPTQLRATPSTDLTTFSEPKGPSSPSPVLHINHWTLLDTMMIIMTL